MVVPADPLHSMHWGHNNTAQMLSYNWTTNTHEAGSPVGTVGFDANAQAAWDGSAGLRQQRRHHRHHRQRRARSAIPTCCRSTGYDYGDNDTNPDDNSSSRGHGTACAGVAAARNNTLGTAGIAAGLQHHAAEGRQQRRAR